MYKLRDYQQLNKDQIRQQFRQNRRVLYQAGTGSGKTVTAASIVKDADTKGSNIWFIAHRRELIEQASDTFARVGTHPGIIMAGFRYQPSRSVQCASIDTLRVRLLKNDALVVTNTPNLIIIDEAHRSLSKSYRDLLDRFPNAYVLGLTATPIRSDGRGLGHIYDSMVQAPSIEELIEMGHLVQPRYFTGASPDLTGVRTQNYDYAAGELEERMNEAELRGDVVEQWIRHGEGRKSIVFASGVKHSKALCEDFNAAGIPAMHIDGTTLNRERMDLIEDFRRNDKYKVLCNCAIVTEGFDVPEVGCISIATSTKIISKYLQMAGRALRPHEGKKDCIILDHGENILRHGFVEDPIPWELDTNGRITDRIPEAREHLVKQFECHVCGCVFSGRVRCPECGTRLEIQPQHELINTVEELIEIKRGRQGAKAADEQKTYTKAQKRNFYAQIVAYAEGANPTGKKYAPGWVGHTYRAKFGVWPRGMDDVQPKEPEPQVLAFIRAKNAAYHIRRKHSA